MHHTDRASGSVYFSNNLGCHVRAGDQINRFDGFVKTNWLEFFQEESRTSVNTLNVLYAVCGLYTDLCLLHRRVFLYMMFTMWLSAWFQMSLWICAALRRVNRGPCFLIHVDMYVVKKTDALGESPSKKRLFNCAPSAASVVFFSAGSCLTRPVQNTFSTFKREEPLLHHF